MTGHCQRCRAEVLDVHTVHGFELALDPEALDPLGELRALVAGRSTYTRYTITGDVHPRLAYKILERPAGSRARQEVHAVHRCPPPPPGKMSA